MATAWRSAASRRLDRGRLSRRRSWRGSAPPPGLRRTRRPHACRALGALEAIDLRGRQAGFRAPRLTRAAPKGDTRAECEGSCRKRLRGNFFEDFRIGQTIRHAVPRTVTAGDAALYTALYGTRFAVQSSDAFAKAVGYAHAPLDDMLVFHIVFGKTVPDISLNAVANLGYANCRFLQPVYPGDTLSATSEVIGLKENSNSRPASSMCARAASTTGRRLRARLRTLGDGAQARPDRAGREGGRPEPAEERRASPISARPARPSTSTKWDFDLSGAPHRFGDYRAGETIDHIDGMTVEEAEHMLATRLYQNTAKVHFNQFSEKQGRFGKRLIYGGHVISLARSLSFNGLANAFHIAAINGGRHVSPLFSGDTVFAWSQVLECAPVPGRGDVGALRLRTIATKDRPCSEPPLQGDKLDPAVILDLDYWALVPV